MYLYTPAPYTAPSNLAVDAHYVKQSFDSNDSTPSTFDPRCVNQIEDYGLRLFVGLTCEMSHATHTPPAMVATNALSVLSSVTQGLYDVELPYNNPILSPTSINTLIAVPSGGGKSRVCSLLKRPISDFECEQESNFATQRQAYTADLKIWKLKESELIKERKNAASHEHEAIDDRIKALHHQEPSEPKQYILTHSDVTPFALKKNLQYNRNAALFIDEAGVFLTNGFEEMASTLNQAWSNDSITLTRGSQPPLRLNGCRVSATILLQKTVLEECLKSKKTSNILIEQGFMARCLYYVSPPFDNQSTSQIRSKSPNWEGNSWQKEFYKKINELLKKTLDQGSQRHVMRFSQDAISFWWEIERTIKQRRAQATPREKYYLDRYMENLSRVAAVIQSLSKDNYVISTAILTFAHELCWKSFTHYASLLPVPELVNNVLKINQYLLNCYENTNRIDALHHYCNPVSLPVNDLLQCGPVRKKQQLDEALAIVMALCGQNTMFYQDVFLNGSRKPTKCLVMTSPPRGLTLEEVIRYQEMNSQHYIQRQQYLPSQTGFWGTQPLTEQPPPPNESGHQDIRQPDLHRFLAQNPAIQSTSRSMY